MRKTLEVLLCWMLVGCLALTLIPQSDAFIFGQSGRLECQGNPRRRSSCSGCRYVCQCPGDSSKVFFRVAARNRGGRCLPVNRVMLNCVRFRWCATCRTNLKERDYTGCKRRFPGAPRHH